MALVLAPAQLYEFDTAIVVPVSIFGLPETVKLLDKSWIRRTEFHVTLTVEKRINALLKKAGKSIDRVEIWQAIEQACQATGDLVVTIGDEVRHVHEGERQTFAVMCEVTGLDQFFTTLNANLPVETPYPPTHVTLYTLQPGIGIGIQNQEELDTLTRVLTSDEAESFKAQTNFDEVFGGA